MSYTVGQSCFSMPLTCVVKPGAVKFRAKLRFFSDMANYNRVIFLELLNLGFWPEAIMARQGRDEKVCLRHTDDHQPGYLIHTALRSVIL